MSQQVIGSFDRELIQPCFCVRLGRCLKCIIGHQFTRVLLDVCFNHAFKLCNDRREGLGFQIVGSD